MLQISKFVDRVCRRKVPAMLSLFIFGQVHRLEPVCSREQYCCPDAKKCLTPTRQFCGSNATACPANQACCPITQICVIPGATCKSPCTDTTTFCDPDIRECVKTALPAHFCEKHEHCNSPERCNFLTHLCGTETGDRCKPEVGEPVCDRDVCRPGSNFGSKGRIPWMPPLHGHLLVRRHTAAPRQRPASRPSTLG